VVVVVVVGIVVGMVVVVTVVVVVVIVADLGFFASLFKDEYLVLVVVFIVVVPTSTCSADARSMASPDCGVGVLSGGVPVMVLDVV